MARLETEAEERFYHRLSDILTDDALSLVEKGRDYGDSWRKRGGTGAFMMLARKWDRIEVAAERAKYDIFEAIEHDRRDEGLLDDIRDLRRYLTLVEDHMTRDVFREMAPVPVGSFSSGSDDEAESSMADHAASIAAEVRHERG